LRARTEPTQLERLSDASFLGELILLPANVRLDWKVIARYKHSSLFGLVVSNKGNKFYLSLMMDTNKLECLHVLKLGQLFVGKGRCLSYHSDGLQLTSQILNL
jgi:hypothetical protein